MYPPLFIAAILLFASPVWADKLSDSVALEGIEVGKIAWDVTQGNPSILTGRLDVIHETYRDMQRQAVTPKMLFTFRGGAILLLQRDIDALPLADQADAELAQARLAELIALPGVRMEACQIAMRRAGLEAEDLIPGVHAVGNTFLSLMGFGQRGYITLPIN